jgi:hypothetical protein
MIAENYYEVQSEIRSSTGSITVDTFYYNDLIVVRVSPEGEIERTDKIEKRQKSSGDNGFYSSYALGIIGDRLCFVFNDHPDNLNLKKGKPVTINTFAKKATAVLVTLYQDGEQTREELFNRKETGIITRPKVCEQISEREMILFGQRKKKQRFASITFN